MKFLFLGIILLSFAFSPNVYAVYYSLSDEQIRQAIEYGEKGKDADNVAFLAEWISVSDDGYEWATLNTKFSILAYEAKQSSLTFKKLTEAQVSRALSEVEDSLSFHVVLYGNASHFTKDCHAVLLYKNKHIQPINEQNDPHPTTSNLGTQTSVPYRAACRYDFPNYCVEPDANVILVIIGPFNKERKFAFNLREMR
ncbi:MAG TPA: hypothetical protein ACFYEC_03440 [Candidatus Brocadiaceae bacterium]